MISLEKAKALKEAGLVWKPKNGDFFANDFSTTFVISGEHDLCEELGGKMWFFNGYLRNRDCGYRLNETASYCMQKKSRYTPRGFNIFHISSYEDFVWLPRLDQLLAEIERLGYKWDIGQPPEPNNYPYVVFLKGGLFEFFLANTPEDAAADALLWILQNNNL